MSSSSSTIFPTSSSTDVFTVGKHVVKLIKIEPKKCVKDSSESPPKPILLGTPLATGAYPLYNVAGPDANEEIKSTAEITNWLSKGLSHLLPSEIQPNLEKLALAGHSRGGKVAFALALNDDASACFLKYSALIGIDPVDGMDMGKQTPPPVLTYIPHSFKFDVPALVIGSGLGEVRKNRLFPACAPKGVNHENFYNECPKPSYYFVAKDYGHLDMLDDDTRGIRGKATYCLCKNGESREPMRRFVGGIVVAFMKAYLEGDFTELKAVKDGHDDMLPLELQKVESFV